MSAPAKWSLSVAALLIGGIFALYLRQTQPGTGTVFLPKCALNLVTGIHCPGCGNTRATHALLNGDLVGAIHQNVAMVVALPFLLVGGFRVWLMWMFPQRIRKQWLPFRWRWGYSLSLIGLVLAFTVLRNVPYAPLSWLAPVPLTSNPPQDPAAPAPATPPPSVP